MDYYTDVGGACGEIEAFQPSDRELGLGWAKVMDPDTLDKLNKDAAAT